MQLIINLFMGIDCCTMLTVSFISLWDGCPIEFLYVHFLRHMGHQMMSQGNMNMAARAYSLPGNSNQNQYMQGGAANNWGTSGIYYCILSCFSFMFTIKMRISSSFRVVWQFILTGQISYLLETWWDFSDTLPSCKWFFIAVWYVKSIFGC